MLNPHGNWLNLFGGNFPQYTFTKFAQILNANYLHRRHHTYGKEEDDKNWSIDFNSLHPGGVETNAWRNGGAVLAFLRKVLFGFFMKNELQGAQTVLYLAVNAPKGTSGKYWDKNCEIKPNPAANEHSKQRGIV